MSYNTRRSTTFPPTPQQSSAAVGQRRPVVTNNFVSGGQLPTNQQKPVSQLQQQQRPAQSPQQSGISFRGQGTPQTFQSSQNYSSQATPTQARYQQGQQENRSTPQTQLTKPTPTITKQEPIVPGANPPAPDNNGDSMDIGEGKKKWFKNRGTGKISKSEKVRRRNIRLSKILQPKNAVMILNELVKGCHYTVDELPVKVDANMFRASVTFEGQEFVGAGRTKISAKNNAAETALKHLIKNKQLSLKKEGGDSDGGEEKMEIGEDDGGQVMPWTHIASFAMYKLFSNWGEDPSVAHKAQELLGISVPKAAGTSSNTRAPAKPAKKMPENPEKVNPLMLMNQMVPEAVWNEVGKSGTAPNMIFTYSVTVDGKSYTGTGNNKKAAKKLAAFAACHEIFNIDYPADVWDPSTC